MWIRFALICCCFNLAELLQSHEFRSPGKFVNLRRVQNRIEALDRSVKLRHQHRPRWWSGVTTTTGRTTTEEDLFDTYGELGQDEGEAPGKMKDDEDNRDGPDFEDDDEERLFEEVLDDEYEDMQAEEPTEKPTTQATPVYSPRSVLSQMKWNRLGTHEKVAQERNKHINSQLAPEGIAAAHNHFVLAGKLTMCKTPAPKVVSIHSVHPNSTVNYIPACTVLHRCAEDTGCCRHDETCRYKTRELVHLYVYLRILGTTSTTTTKLAFYNDTECECQKADEMGYESFSTTSKQPQMMGYRSRFSYNQPEGLTRCRCPEEFIPKTAFNMKCMCECDGNNEGCIKMQRGEEHLSLKDRRCISDNECAAPHCEYGPYKRNHGRCPRNSEREEMYRKFRESSYLNSVQSNN